MILATPPRTLHCCPLHLSSTTTRQDGLADTNVISPWQSERGEEEQEGQARSKMQHVSSHAGRDHLHRHPRTLTERIDRSKLGPPGPASPSGLVKLCLCAAVHVMPTTPHPTPATPPSTRDCTDEPGAGPLRPRWGPKGQDLGQACATCGQAAMPPRRCHLSCRCRNHRLLEDTATEQEGPHPHPKRAGRQLRRCRHRAGFAWRPASTTAVGEMNRQWMYGDRCHPDFINGMHYFLNVAEANRQSNGFIYCPCSSCKNMTDYSTSKTIHVHLLQNGFMPSYNCWTKHGERGVILEDNEEEEDSDNYPMFTEDGDSRMGEDEAEEEPIFDEPIFDDPDDDLGRAILDAKISCGSEKERLKLQKMLEDHKTLLYPNCEDGQKKLGTTLELLQWKAENGTSDKGFEKLLKIIKKMLPGENVLPSSTYEAKKVVCPLGLEVQKIHACINDCILYRGEYENLNACPVCSALRYKIRRDDPGDVEGESTPRKRVPAKVMWPEGSISKGYGTEEVIEFCVDFIPDLKPIGVPESRYEGRLRGKGTLGKKAITCMDGHSFTQAHYTVLHNSILVAPYKEEHKDILRSKYPEEREDWIDGEHMKTFGGWLQTRLMNATDDEQLYLLAKQPSSTISTFQGYEINGNTFYTFAQDKKSTNQNSGVRFDAADDNGKKVTYYGYIEEIWELEYGPNFKVPLFRCKWFNLKDGVQVDPQYGMTTVDLKNLGHGAASTLSSSFEQGVVRYMLYLIEQGVLIMPTALVPVAPTSRY
ncbi:hypothetical protein QYE76_000766 [Lolium multiflorum]|uniref:Transposase-associated domain-containing protein n=1 Tax=Lolium multiflorum TaxID=4521 RepID=A0AAD8RI74_LOLMU|nr:hypothetical protein QYE76_000766 [Lolium multiflorum]